MARRLRTRAVLAAVATLALASPASAAPQVGVAATTGLALTDLRASNGPRFAYHLGARADALFLRDKPGQLALGPYVEAMTAAFDTFEAGGGASLLVPVGAPALVLSAGAFARTGVVGWEPGATAKLFWGARSFNYHAPYGLALGLFVQGRHGLGDARQSDVIGGVEIDLGYLALPFLLGFEALRR